MLAKYMILFRFCAAVFSALFISLMPSISRAQMGTAMYDAIPIDVGCSGNSFWDYPNTSYNFYESYGYGSGGPWYTFTLPSDGLVNVSLCGSSFDTQVYLLDEYGGMLAWNADNGPLCWGMDASLSEYLQAGTYYVVAQGQGSSTGYISVDIGIILYGAAPGSFYNTAINAGTFNVTGSFTDTMDNGSTCLNNEIGQASRDIFYTFTLATNSTVTLSHCGSAISDSFIHLLDNTGQTIATNDDGGTNCSNIAHSHLVQVLPPGTYYVVSEGAGSITGSITTNISVVPLVSSLPSISYNIPSPIQLAMSFNASPTNTGGSVSGDVLATTIAGGSNVNNPLNTASDQQGNVYVADAGNHRIIKITTGGAITTLAGAGYAGYADGMGTSAVFRHPSGLAVDASGNVYVSDQQNHRIRKITPSGVVTTLAGSGSAGYANGSGTSASFSSPIGLVIDNAGNLFVADYSNHRIRQVVLSTGIVSTYAGDGSAGMSNGAALSASFRNPMGLALDQTNNLYVADRLNHAVRKIASDGMVSTLAGNGSAGSSNGTAGGASFNHANSIAMGGDGNLYVADYLNNMIRKVTPFGVVTTLAGTTSAGTVDGIGSAIRLHSPYGINAHGNAVYVAQNGSYAIRKLQWGGYSISPTLPPGLTFDGLTGNITGTPTGIFPPTLYTVSASNNAGTSTTSFTLSVVQSGVQASSDQNYIMTYVNKDISNVTPGQVIDSSTDPLKVNTTISYIDGLGRAMQNIQVSASPEKKDIITPISYDAEGREVVKYLPYRDLGVVGSYRAQSVSSQNDFYANPPVGVVVNNFPFKKTLFEASPLNRVIEQGAAGQDWQPVPNSEDGHTLKSKFEANVFEEVRRWSCNTSNNGASSDFYPPNTLYKTITKDENWLEINGLAGVNEEFKDFEGNIVLKRIWETNSKSLNTYYVYDDFGNLRYVLPPAVNHNSDISAEITSFTEQDAVFDRFIYGYHYDSKKRLIEKKLPGKGWEFMVYNSLDQLVLSQDANQAQNKQWLFTKYDMFGRKVMTGFFVKMNNNTRSEMQDEVNAEVTGTASNHPLWEIRAVTGDYTNLSYPRPTDYSITKFTVSYYDDYNFPGAANYPYAAKSNMTRGLQTGNLTNVLGTSDNLLEVIYYDDYGRIAKTFSQHYQGATLSSSNYDELTNEWTFNGLIKSSTRSHVNTGVTTKIKEIYTYDHWDRKSTVSHKIDTNPGAGSEVLGSNVLLRELLYNEIGQLVGKKLHNGLQNTTFKYNEREWLTNSQSTITSTGSSVFSMELKYNQPETGTSPQYNGNIANQIYINGGDVNNTFKYEYDKLNRLLNAEASNNLSETITYDVMGNIKALWRQGTGQGASYYDNYLGNKLMGVSGTMGGTFDYDANGNVKKDSRRQITDVNYNHLNLPQSIVGLVNVSYLYGANGKKLRKISSAIGSTDYVNGINYTSNNVIDFVQTSEGMARRNGNSGAYSYEYNITDNLGNVRAAFYQHPISNNLEVIQRNDYYAFGLRKSIPLGNGATSIENNYLYNGMELQPELEQYDYGARFFDPVIGRWNVVDPLTEKMQSHSPYNYAFNNPIRFIDIAGLAPFDHIFDIHGKLLSTTKIGNNILVQTDAGLINIKDLPYSKVNGQIIAQVGGYYGSQLGIPRGTIGYKAHPKKLEKVLGFTDGNNIFLNITGGSIHSSLGNYNNLKNVLIHEKDHMDKGHGAKEINSLEHAKVYLAQFSHQSFRSTSADFKIGQIGSVIEYLQDAYNKEGFQSSSISDVIYLINKQISLYGYQIAIDPMTANSTNNLKIDFYDNNKK